MALNVGPDFKQRWLNTPEAVRQTFIDDLSRICEVLKPETAVEEWLVRDQQLQKESERKIEAAYAQRKAELIEEARIRRQLALEKALAEKRAEEQAYAEQLRRDEERKFAEQTQKLAEMRHMLDTEVQDYAARYQKNPDQVLDFAKGRLNIDDTQILSELESLRLRLELEAETVIEQTINALREKLHAAAKEEIDYILKNSDLAE
ncbi:MAG: cell division protein BlhA [Acinetobacter sp.]